MSRATDAVSAVTGDAARIRVNGPRLWSRLMDMAAIGATAHGGCNRQALTDLDLEGRRLLSQWGRAAGCSVRVDAIGNLFVRRTGRDDTLPVVAVIDARHDHAFVLKATRRFGVGTLVLVGTE